jgi:uncharacterized protein YqgV (UPF0045/DUF77 family)
MSRQKVQYGTSSDYSEGLMGVSKIMSIFYNFNYNLKSIFRKFKGSLHRQMKNIKRNHQIHLKEEVDRIMIHVIHVQNQET